MLSLLDIAERVQRGPKMDEDAWNMALFKKIEENRKKFGVKYPGEGRFFNRDEMNGQPVADGPDDIREIYDLVRHCPTPAYREVYEDTKRIFREAGMPF